MPDAAAISGHKRRRDEGRESPQTSPPDELPLGSSLSLSDTMIALRVMHAQFPKIEKGGIRPFVLKTQLYSSVKDRTLVDRQLELLKKDRSICIFKLNTGQDDHAVMFMDDYLRLVERSIERVEVKDKNDLAVFDWFRTYVIGTKLDTGIGQYDLYTLLSSGGKVKDEHVSLLIKAGLLTRQLIDPNSYWFAIPSIGTILKGLSQGRKELLSFLNRRKYKEMLMAPLEKQQLRLSPLDMRFHLRDLIGSGHLKTLETTMGVLVQVSKD